MEALKKHASKLREQVSKQQKAVFKQFSARYNQDPSLVDEAELECHQNLQRLYSTTRAAKHFQRNIVRGVEGFIAISTKQMEIVKRLAEDCCKYGVDNEHFGFALAKASVEFGNSHKQIEKEREDLLKVLGEQVFEPLREMIMSAPLEDARLLTYRYQRIRQDMESQIADVMRKQLKSKESSGNTDNSVKLQHAESKLSDLRTTLAALGRETTAAVEAVEAQQQQVTYERLLAMVDAERTYHQNAADILNKLHDEMLLARHHSETIKHYDEQSSEPESETAPAQVHSDSTSEDPVLTKPSESTGNGQEVQFLGEVIHPFDAQADGELSLSVGEYVVVRQVASNGWSEGECKGKAGWFPSAYVERRDKAPASKRRPPPLWLGEGPHGAGSERGGGHGAAAPRRLHLPAGPILARRARPRGDGLLAAAAAGPRAWIRPTGGAPAGDKAGRRWARRHGDQQEQAVPAGMAARPRAARGRASSARSPRGRCRRPRGCWPSRHGVLRGRAARVLALRAPGGRAEVLPPGEWGWGQGRRRGGSCPGEDALTSRTRGRHFPAPSHSATRIK